jgi:hypothetical protein
MTAIAVDLYGSGALNYYSTYLAQASAVYAPTPNWAAMPQLTNIISVPSEIVATATKRMLSDADVRELNQALFDATEFLYDID